ncbi:hypothetical protein [Streptomyces sp. NRRL F-5135]|uniref:hypothetical protein n=1 Tax=Streptomyces sp. NRRL F-5135 TaxID=1463858 RepID=UPI001F421EB3|nr:hypothetical protein [Streptomyces sp. NRRL F-5135]
MDDLGRRLRREARAHRPDRERMLARMERGMAGPDPAPAAGPGHRPAPWPRVAAVAGGAVGVLGLSLFALGPVVDGAHEPSRTVAATERPAVAGPSGPADAPEHSGTASRSPRATTGGAGSAASGTDGSDSAASADAERSPAAGRPSAGGSDASARAGTRSRYLRSAGAVDPRSNAYWAQNNLTLTTERPLTALTVELRIAQTGGVRDTGSWRSLPMADFSVSVHAGGGALVFRWTLRDGATVPAGTHMFAAQYDHAEGGRDATGDRYTARASAVGGAAEVTGDFTSAGAR